MPRRPVSSRLPGVAWKRSFAISRASSARSARPAVDQLHLVDGERGGARGGDGRAGDVEGHPDHAQRRDRPQRPATMAGRDACQAQQREHRDGEQGDHQRSRDGGDEVRSRGADRVAQRLDPDPRVARVVDGLERPVERREEADVEDLDDDEQAQHRSRDHDQHAPPAGGQEDGHGDDDEELEREPRERAEREAARLVRRDERGPDEQQGSERERHRDARVQLRGRRGVPAAPQPPHALADRRREQHERGDQQRLRERPGQHPGGRDRQHDALRRRDHHAPAAPRQRRAHPWRQALAGQERVARGPDREHPRTVLGAT